MTTNMPWGRFRGDPISEIETSYLVWVLEHANAVTTGLRTAIRTELARRFPPPPPENGAGVPLPGELQPVAERILKRGFRELAREAHPDHGGSDAAMRTVLAAYELLCTHFKVDA